MKRILTTLVLLLMMSSAHSVFAQSTGSTPPNPNAGGTTAGGATGVGSSAADTSRTETPPEAPKEEPFNRTGIGLKEAGFDINAIDPDTNLPTFNIENSTDPLQVVDSVLLRYIINPIFFLAGGVAVLVIMYSSFRIVTSRGEEEGLTAAKNTLIWAAAGLALVLLAYTLVGNLVSIVLQQL